jgi:hypothetical protein
MPSRLCCLQFLILIALSLPTAAQGQSSVRSVTIHTTWGGLGTPQDATVVIEANGTGFTRRGQAVETRLVDALVSALKSAVVPQPSMANLGVTESWLKANLSARREAPDATANQRRLYVAAFTDPQHVAKVLPNLFSFPHTDDYPAVGVDVVFEDGSRLSAESTSQWTYMLPWKVEGGADTYNSDISRAVSALLPPRTVNKDRLAGSQFATQLADSVMQSIETEYKMQGADDRVGGALGQLRRSYEVVAAEINPYHHPEYGVAWDKGKPHEENLHATLRKSSLPPSVTIALVLQCSKDSIEGLEQFLQAAAKYEQLALSVPWLNDYIRDHPKVPVRISYVHNRSFGDKAMSSFVEDMKARQRQDLIALVQSKVDEVALLMVGNTYSESYWLVLPDKRMLLWRYGGPSGLLKWARDDFPAGQCASYQTSYGGCSGREVKPDGNLAERAIPRDQPCMSGRPLNTRLDIDLFPVMDGGKGGFIDRTGEVIIPLCFDAVGDFSEGLARFERDKRWGYIDKSGAVVIEPKFLWAQEFSEGLARVQVSGFDALSIDGRWGFIDKTGALAVSPDHHDTLGGAHNNIGSDGPEASFHDGLAKVQVGGMTGYIDKTGRVVIAGKFTHAYPFAEGAAAATTSPSGDGGWGHIDKAGNWLVAPAFEWASSFSEGLAPVERGGTCGYVDKTGSVVLQPRLSSPAKECSSVWGDFSEGVSRWNFGKKYGYIDRIGRVVIPARYDLTYHFSDGLAAVVVNGKWGYIDHSGKMVIAPMELSRAEDFHHGLAFVETKDGRYGYIDKTGKFVWKPTFLYADVKVPFPGP